MQDFSGILQVDGYAGYNRLIAPEHVDPDIQFAYCRAHARGKLVEITCNGSAPIAENWATIVSIIEACKFNAVDPQA